MITFRTSAEVTSDRSIVLALPPETPLGKAELTVTISPREATAERSGNLRRHFGAIRSGDPRSASNERIDAVIAHSNERSRD